MESIVEGIPNNTEPYNRTVRRCAISILYKDKYFEKSFLDPPRDLDRLLVMRLGPPWSVLGNRLVVDQRNGFRTQVERCRQCCEEGAGIYQLRCPAVL